MIKDIQSLRAISVIAVVVFHSHFTFHAWDPLVASGLWAGVDVFLVVSGFVISRSLLPTLEATDRPWVIAKGFWLRRAYRLLPAAVFWASLVVLLGLFVNRSGIWGDWSNLLWEYVRSLLYLQDFPFENYALGPYWSLSLEEQFYLVLPVAVILVPHLMRPMPLLGIMVLALLAISVSGWAAFIGNFRVAPLILGILLYRLSQSPLYAQLEPTWIKGPLRPLVFIGSFAALVTLATFGAHWVGVTMGAGWLVWLASYDKGYVSLPDLDRVLQWIGDRSYSIYLSHVPMIFLTYEFVTRSRELNGWIDAPVAWVLTLGVAAASYRWIEVPTRRLGRDRQTDYLRTHEVLTASPLTPPERLAATPIVAEPLRESVRGA